MTFVRAALKSAVRAWNGLLSVRNSPKATLFVTLAAWETGEPSIDKLLLRHEIRRPMSCKGTRPARVPIRRASRLLARAYTCSTPWTTKTTGPRIQGRCLYQDAAASGDIPVSRAPLARILRNERKARHEHNNHNAFPTSARHGLRRWHLDVSFLIICAMSKIGLARDVRTPSRDRIAAKRCA